MKNNATKELYYNNMYILFMYIYIINNRQLSFFTVKNENTQKLLRNNGIVIKKKKIARVKIFKTNGRQINYYKTNFVLDNFVLKDSNNVTLVVYTVWHWHVSRIG